MGKRVGLTLRAPDGKEHRMCRWTNILASIINNIRLVNKDNSHIEDIIKTWYEMREDYESHKADGNFEDDRIEDYAPFPYLAPMGYGLVVVDMVNDEILDCQDYTIPGIIPAIGIKREMHSVDGKSTSILRIGSHAKSKSKSLGKQAFYLDDSKKAAVRFREFFEAGKIAKVREYSIAVDDYIEIDVNGRSFDYVVGMIENSVDLEFHLDMSPYKIIKYDEQNYEDLVKMKGKIKELGFKLNSEEEQIWYEWIREHRE